MSRYLLSLTSMIVPARQESRAEEISTAGHDALLFERFMGGEDAAFAELFDRHNHRLYLYCLKIVGDAVQAEDITQSLWERVIRMRAKGGAVHNPVGFLLKIARNLSINHLRAKRSTPLDLEAQHRLAEETTELSEMEELVLRALPKLPFELREILILNAYSGYRFDEIAKMIGKSPEAVRMSASRARTKLRTIIVEMMESDDTRDAVDAHDRLEVRA